MVNKFLRPIGGAETYLLKLGAYWTQKGHEVSYFGMAHPDNCVGNEQGLYTKQMDFHGGSLLSKLTYPSRIIYSAEAKRKLGSILEQFQPDVMHLNNFNYQLTPSILLAAEAYRKKTGRKLRIIYTAHDSQLICPGHLMYIPKQRQVCEKCLGGNVMHCIRGKCIHGSFLRSCLGALEAVYWKKRKVYRLLDAIVCPSDFMKSRLDTDPVLAPKTVVLRNFTEPPTASKSVSKKEYLLFFGRYSEEKGLRTLLSVCRSLPQIPFVFAGSGPLEPLLEGIPNLRNVGFLNGEALTETIRSARFSVCPSECNENCPFSVMESIMAGTPVLGSDRGGIPELIEPDRTGWLFPAGNEEALREKIEALWESDLPERCADACRSVQFDDLEAYGEKLMRLYQA